VTPQILSFALQQLNLRNTVYILSSSSAPATAFVRPTLSQCINLTTCLTHTDRQQQHGTTPMADTLYSGAECCDEHVSLSVYRSGCPNAYLRNRTSKLRQVFFCARLFISVARSFLVVLRYVMYTSGFANDVTFAYYNCQKQATLKGMYSE